MKALALGATLVAFGRVAAWGLAAAGADGVARTLQLLNEELVINMKLAGQTATSQLSPSVVRRIDAAGFALPTSGAGDPEAQLMGQLSAAQRAAVRSVTDNAALSEVDKMWGITEALFGESPRKGDTS
jgi:hypothetical protein